MIVEWYALKCFCLGSFLTGMAARHYYKYKYEVKHFDVGLVRKKKP